MKNKNAQTSFEFIVLVSFIIFFFTIFFLAIQGNTSDRINLRKNQIVKELAISVQNEINLAFDATEGYSREFDNPTEILNQDYEIGIQDNLLYVRTEDSRYAIALPVPQTTGQPQTGTNTIRKQGGIIYLN